MCQLNCHWANYFSNKFLKKTDSKNDINTVLPNQEIHECYITESVNSAVLLTAVSKIYANSPGLAFNCAVLQKNYSSTAEEVTLPSSGLGIVIQ